MTKVEFLALPIPFLILGGATEQGQTIVTNLGFSSLPEDIV